jgi:hypothetical protein
LWCVDRVESVEIVLALAAADHLAVALGREHVHVQREPRIGGIALEVEGLQVDRVAVDDHRAIEALRDDGLFVAAEVVAPPWRRGPPSSGAVLDLHGLRRR